MAASAAADGTSRRAFTRVTESPDAFRAGRAVEPRMNRAIVSRKTLDALIRAKLATLDGCGAVEALPVAPATNGADGCNWVIPGWVGDLDHVKRCVERLEHYLDFLRSQFDIPRPGSALNGAD